STWKSGALPNPSRCKSASVATACSGAFSYSARSRMKRRIRATSSRVALRIASDVADGAVMMNGENQSIDYTSARSSDRPWRRKMPHVPYVELDQSSLQAREIRWAQSWSLPLKGFRRSSGCLGAAVLLTANDERLQDHPFVAHALGHPLAIQIFKERDCVLARQAEQVFESGYVDPGRRALLRHDASTHLLQGVAVKHQVVGQLHQHAIAQQQRDDLLRARAVHRQRREHVLQQRRL